MPMVVLTLNIFAANLADRGAVIDRIDVRYPMKTPFGKQVVTPRDLDITRTIPIQTIEQALSQTMGAQAVKQALEVYGYVVTPSKGTVKAKLPPYRQDLMHPMDVVEDVAISRVMAISLPSCPHSLRLAGSRK